MYHVACPHCRTKFPVENPSAGDYPVVDCPKCLNGSQSAVLFRSNDFASAANTLLSEIRAICGK